MCNVTNSLKFLISCKLLTAPSSEISTTNLLTLVELILVVEGVDVH